MPLTVCDPSEHRHSLKGLSPVFSLETVASGLWTAGLSDQVHGFPLLFTCSNNLLKVKRCCRGRRHKTGDGCSPCSSSMSLLKENVVSAPLSLLTLTSPSRLSSRLVSPQRNFSESTPSHSQVFLLSQMKCRETSSQIQFSSVTQSCLTLCDPMDCSTPGFPVHHQLLELAQTHVHRVGDAIQPSHPLSSPCPPAFNLSQHLGLFE